MAKQFLNTLKTNPKQIADQLRKPTGEVGVSVGKEMNKGNEHICKNSYKQVKLKDGEKVLEIGMGNGLFVGEFISKAKNAKFYGIDFSDIMVEESIKNNKSLIENNQVNFQEGSIEKLPFEDNYFDSIVTANTIYFWPNLDANTKELLRVLKPEGRLIIGYRDKKTLEQLPFTEFGFKKFTPSEVELLLSKSGFTIKQTEQIKEPDIDFGTSILKMTGFYTTAYK